jgi:phosphoribosyl 1,2-cyclic phosphodiesterase
MNITICGARGSIPTTSPENRVYGGNTACIEVEADGSLILLDAGSGIQHVNLDIVQANKRVDILLTHLHIDHIQGLGFFRPLFTASAEVHIWGPATSGQSLRARLGRYFSPPLFPVYFRNLNCHLELHEVEESNFTIGPFQIQSSYVIHPGPTLGYRVQHKRGVLAYMPDHEPALGPYGLLNDVRWLSGGNLAMHADILLHDAQYSAEEYKTRVGWGHSSMEDALRYASLTGVKRLLLMHHDPLHTDAQLDGLTQQLQENAAYSFPYEMAVEGMKIAL